MPPVSAGLTRWDERQRETGLLMTTTTMKSRRNSARSAFIALFAMIAGLLMASGAFAQQVTVQGNHRVDSETIRSYVTGSGAGSLEEARQNLLATGMFSSVRVSRSGSTVVISVVENTVINRVAFEGNKKVEQRDSRGRGPDQGARPLQPGHRRRRRPAHPRRLPPPRPRPRAGDAAHRRPAQRPHRRRLHASTRATRPASRKSASSATTRFRRVGCAAS